MCGSSAVLAKGIYSLVDTGNELHPFEYGKERNFWTLGVAVPLFDLGGGMSIYAAITDMLKPEALGDPTWNYVVPGVADL